MNNLKELSSIYRNHGSSKNLVENFENEYNNIERRINKNEDLI